jgi:hypothetical protein
MKKRNIGTSGQFSGRNKHQWCLRSPMILPEMRTHGTRPTNTTAGIHPGAWELRLELKGRVLHAKMRTNERGCETEPAPKWVG